MQLFGSRSDQAGGSKHKCFGKIIFQTLITGTAHAFRIQPLPDLIIGPGAFSDGLSNFSFRYRITYTYVHPGTHPTRKFVCNTNNRTNENHLQQIFFELCLPLQGDRIPAYAGMDE